MAFILSAAASNNYSSATKLSGVIVDQMGAVIPGASVALLSADKVRNTKTNESGQFEFANLPPAIYDLKAERTGFKTVTMENLRIADTADQLLTITLLVVGPESCGNVMPAVSYEGLIENVNLVDTISDFWEGPLDKTIVTVTMLKSGQTHVATTGTNGQFQFSDLQPGKYTIKASRNGYVERSGISFWVTHDTATKLTPIYIVKRFETRIIICQ